MTYSAPVAVSGWARGGTGQSAIVAIALPAWFVAKRSTLDLACWAGIKYRPHTAAVAGFPVKIRRLLYTLTVLCLELLLLELLLELLLNLLKLLHWPVKHGLGMRRQTKHNKSH